MSRTARIALLQLPAFAIEDAEASLAHTLRRIDETARERPDIIVLPEVTYPAYFLGTRRPSQPRVCRLRPRQPSASRRRRASMASTSRLGSRSKTATAAT